MIEKDYKLYNFLCPDVTGYKKILDLKSGLPSPKQNKVTPSKNKNEITTNTSSPPLENDILNLQPGELVQVRLMDEISVTLDREGKYKGLYFMPEMEKFCGKRFKVFKRAEIIKFESTREIRKLLSPTVFLEGVYCDGEHHEGCDRACFHFWREAWLKRI
jgi:hypothetical protein